MSNKVKIDKEDVLNVFYSIKPNGTISDDNVTFVIDNIDRAMNDDPTGNWNYWVESLLSELKLL